MDPIRKELTCGDCGKTAAVRVMLGAAKHTWHCPHCHELQTSDQASVAAAPPAPDA